MRSQILAVQKMQEGFRYAAKERFLGKLIMLFCLFIFLYVPARFLATLFVSHYYGDTYFHRTLVEVIGFLGMMVFGLPVNCSRCPCRTAGRTILSAATPGRTKPLRITRSGTGGN